MKTLSAQGRFISLSILNKKFNLALNLYSSTKEMKFLKYFQGCKIWDFLILSWTI